MLKFNPKDVLQDHYLSARFDYQREVLILKERTRPNLDFDITFYCFLVSYVNTIKCLYPGV